MKPYTHFVCLLAIGITTHLGATVPLIEINIPTDLSPDLQKLPSISLETLVKNGVAYEKTVLSKEIELAISSNNLPELSKLLESSDVKDKTQAAIAMGRLTAHIPEAKERLANFIAVNSNPMRAGIGKQFLEMSIATAAAEESFAALGAPPGSMPVTQPSTPTNSPKSTPTPIEESPSLTRRVAVVVALVAALGLLWLLLKKRK